MKKHFWMWLLPVVVFFGCSQKEAECPDVSAQAPAGEVTALRTYIQANNLIAIEHSSGVFYRIENAGTGDKPTPCSVVTINYVGRLTNGTQIDAANNVEFNLSGLITGWQIGVPLISSGGRITLYIPPSLAYGTSGVGAIPPNSILVFNIELIAVD
jgi:FKBP-type peptidyl-prolyl cis-trans isomerase FkpA